MNKLMLLRRIWIVWICSMLLAVSCKEKEAPYLSEDRMLDILRELHLADVLAEAHGGSLGWRHAARNEHYDEILDNFGLSRPEFYRSYVYYLNNPEIMDSIYVRMVQDIEKRMDVTRQQEYNSKKDTAKWNKSLKNRGPAKEPTTPSTEKKSTEKQRAKGSDS